jgi:hypothetical protein
MRHNFRETLGWNSVFICVCVCVCVCDDKEQFLILNFFKKKLSQLNAIMTLNTIMRKNIYFGLMNIHTHDVFI